MKKTEKNRELKKTPTSENKEVVKKTETAADASKKTELEDPGDSLLEKEAQKAYIERHTIKR